MKWVAGLLVLAACSGGDCPPMTAQAEGLRVVVTPVDGCDGPTWRADVTFRDGRSQRLAGERHGMITAVMLGDFTGDSIADLVVAVQPRRIYAFAHQGSVFFGRELPPAPDPDGALSLVNGAVWVGSARWDVATAAWRTP